MKRGILGFSRVLLLGISAIILLGGCQGQPTTNPVGEVPERAFPVETVNAAWGSLQEAVSVVGELSPYVTVNVTSKVSAKVEGIRVNKGDRVAAGQILAVLEQTDFNNQVKQAERGLLSAQASFENAKAGHEHQISQAQQSVDNAELAYKNSEINLKKTQDTYADAQTTYERMKQLYEANAISKRDFEQAETGLSQARAGLEQVEIAIEQAKAGVKAAELALRQAERTEGIAVAEAAVKQAELSLELAQEQLNNTVVKAPVDGEIAMINVEIGEFVSPQSPFFQIIQVDPMLVKGKVTEEALGKFAVGDTVSVYVKAINQTVEGKIRYISAVTEPQTKAYTLEVELASSSQNVRSGMIAEIIAQDAESAEQSLIIPVSALIMENQNYYVYRVVGDRAERAAVQLGRENSEYVEIIEGLHEGEQVIVKGHLIIEEGALIQVMGGK